jgi:hypothetical protein
MITVFYGTPMARFRLVVIPSISLPHVICFSSFIRFDPFRGWFFIFLSLFAADLILVLSIQYSTVQYSTVCLCIVYTRKICNLSSKAIDTQSGCAADHCKLLISPAALYAKMGSSTGRLGMALKSQIRAWESSPAVQI